MLNFELYCHHHVCGVNAVSITLKQYDSDRLKSEDLQFEIPVFIYSLIIYVYEITLCCEHTKQ